MLTKIGFSYRFLVRHFLTLKRTRNFISGLFLTGGVLAGFFIPQVNTYAESSALNRISTAQFEPVETVTLTGLEFPLKDKNYGISQFFSPGHPGVDLEIAAKTPVYPITEGEVKEINRWWISYGHHLVINHGSGLQSLYAHLSSIEVKAGDKVGKDTMIGRVGSTGWATGNHLHLEIWQNGKPLNPMEVIGEK